mgnify:CR=1 FL=1
MDTLEDFYLLLGFAASGIVGFLLIVLSESAKKGGGRSLRSAGLVILSLFLLATPLILLVVAV